MRIVIAASIYPPEIGGPALYAKNLKESLERAGHEVVLVRYGVLKRLPSGIRHLFYAIKLFIKSGKADAIIAFDTYSGGLPALLPHMLRGIPLVIRIGGDFVWEQYIERTHDLVPISRIYERRDQWNLKERVVFATTRFVARRARLVFSSHWLLDIWREPYRLDLGHTHVVENAIGNLLSPLPPTRKNFLFFTRQIALKNAEAFRRAFAKVKTRHSDIELEEGTVSHEELMKRMRACYAVVLPSISEVTPNYIIDAIRCGKPFLLTKYSGYADRFGHYGVMVDPLDEDDMARGIEALVDKDTYERLRTHIAGFAERHTYDDIAREFIAIVQKSV